MAAFIQSWMPWGKKPLDAVRTAKVKADLQTALGEFKVQKRLLDVKIQKEKQKIFALLNKGKDIEANIFVPSLIMDIRKSATYEILPIYCNQLQDDITKLATETFRKKVVCSVLFAAQSVTQKELSAAVQALQSSFDVAKFGDIQQEADPKLRDSLSPVQPTFAEVAAMLEQIRFELSSAANSLSSASSGPPPANCNQPVLAQKQVGRTPTIALSAASGSRGEPVLASSGAACKAEFSAAELKEYFAKASVATPAKPGPMPVQEQQGSVLEKRSAALKEPTPQKASVATPPKNVPVPAQEQQKTLLAGCSNGNLVFQSGSFGHPAIMFADINGSFMQSSDSSGEQMRGSFADRVAAHHQPQEPQKEQEPQEEPLTPEKAMSALTGSKFPEKVNPNSRGILPFEEVESSDGGDDNPCKKSLLQTQLACMTMDVDQLANRN